MIWFLLIIPLWILFNWAAPLASLYKAERLGLGRLPADLLRLHPRVSRHIRFYLCDLRHSYGFSVWMWPYTVVVFDRKFFSAASGDLVRFVVAHELGHTKGKDHVQRWWAIVTGVALLPAMRRRFVKQELAADRYAIALTGFRRDQFIGAWHHGR